MKIQRARFWIITNLGVGNPEKRECDDPEVSWGDREVCVSVAGERARGGRGGGGGEAAYSETDCFIITCAIF